MDEQQITNKEHTEDLTKNVLVLLQVVMHVLKDAHSGMHAGYAAMLSGCWDRTKEGAYYGAGDADVDHSFDVLILCGYI